VQAWGESTLTMSIVPILMGFLIMLPYILVGVGVFLLSGLPMALIAVGSLFLFTFLVIATMK